MYVLAGFPPSTFGRAIDFIKGRNPSAAAVGAPATTADGNLYSEAHLRILVSSVAGFAIRRRSKGPPTPVAPRSITLFYVPARDEEKLLESFDFAVMPESLAALAARDVSGRQLRHYLAAVESALDDALSSQGRCKSALDVVRERVGRLSDGEALLLPPRNFITEDGRLAHRLRDLRRGVRPWSDRFNDLDKRELTSRQIKRIPPDKTRRAFVDSREVAFLVAHPTAYDGLVREVVGETDIAAQASALRSLYRFGAAVPSGFHHDAQLSDGSQFTDFELDCESEGRVRVNGTHANVYPNDFVRAKKKQKI